ECDDEFWGEDPVPAFYQPPGKPSLSTFFNCYLRPNKMLVRGLADCIFPSLLRFALISRRAHRYIVAKLDSALNGWIDGIPPHLRWDPNR
ncbi:hypothetical protein B0H12DRAFT_958640, partial [Mycena haematopus]